MLHILFLILKIIGIILLAILGILVLSACFVLFLPAHYQVRAKTEDGIKQLDFSVKAHWFLHLVAAFVDYHEQKFHWQFRIAWKKFHTSRKKKEDVVKTADDSKVEPDTERASEKAEQIVVKKKKNWFEKIKCTIREICDKIKKLWKMKDQVTDFLIDEIHKSAFQRIKQDVLTLAKRLSPRTLKGYVRFGFEDPYNTGRVLAGLSLLYPFYGSKINIYPEFEKEVLEGDIYMKGRIRGIHLLILVFGLILDKNIRKTYKDFRSLK